MLIVISELDEEQVESTVGRFRTIIERTGGEVHEQGVAPPVLSYEVPSPRRLRHSLVP